MQIKLRGRTRGGSRVGHGWVAGGSPDGSQRDDDDNNNIGNDNKNNSNSNHLKTVRSYLPECDSTCIR